MRKFIGAVCLLFGMGTLAQADDLIAVKSGVAVKATLDRLQKLISDSGFFVVGRVPHSDAATGAGLSLRPTELIIFGKPQSGTPLMQCNQRAGFDLPLRALSWQDESGQVWLAMLDPQVLKQRYALGAECEATLKTMDATVRKFLHDATAP